MLLAPFFMIMIKKVYVCRNKKCGKKTVTTKKGRLRVCPVCGSKRFTEKQPLILSDEDIVMWEPCDKSPFPILAEKLEISHSDIIWLHQNDRKLLNEMIEELTP